MSHDATAQRLIDDLDISWAVQYELARGVEQGSWTWLQATELRLRELTGPNTKAAYVAQVMLGSTARRALASPEMMAIWYVPPSISRVPPLRERFQVGA